MTPPLRRPLALLAAAVALGLCADLLFNGRTPGLSLPLFVALLLATLAWLARAEGLPPTPNNRWLGAAALLFAALVAVRAAPLLIVLNTLAALTLLLLHAALYRAAPLTALASWRVGLGAALAGVQASFAPAPLALQQTLRLRAVGTHGRAMLVVLRGVALATPVLLIFTGLLAMADSVFASYVNIPQGLQPHGLYLTPTSRTDTIGRLTTTRPQEIYPRWHGTWPRCYGPH